jgi:colanic acid/amylovoran biosynthesis glycosyltransferase
MSAGVPVIATRNSAIPEVVRDGLTGLLSPQLDAEAMARNIARLLGDEELRTRMGKTARRIAEQQYDWDHVALQYESVLVSVAAGEEVA